MASLLDHGWDIEMTQDNLTNTLGISVRRRFSRTPEYFKWPVNATPLQIARQLREAASYLEQNSDE